MSEKPTYEELESLVAGLRDKEELLRVITEYSSDYFMRYDRECRLLYANKSAIEVTGLPLEECIGKTHLEMGFPPEMCELWDSQIRGVIESGETRTHSFSIPHDGKLRTMEIRLNPEYSPEGELISVFGISREITEHKAVEDSLRKSEAFVRSIIDNLYNGMVYQVVKLEDGTRKFTYLSDRVRGFFGVTPEEGMVDSGLLYARIHPEDIERMIAEEESALANMSVYDTKARIIGPDGTIHWSHFVSRPKQHEDGLVYWDGIMFDVTDAVAAEQELKIYRDDLEKLVEARTAELKHTTEQLLQAQKMEAIGQLAGGIAHDFNNIMAVICGTTETLVNKTPKDASIMRPLERILNSGRRARDLTMKLLTFARKERLNVKITRPGDLISDIIDILKSTMSAKITIRGAYEAGTPCVNVDANQIFQAVLNMCLNSCDAMPDGGTLTLRLHGMKDEAGERWAVITIEDTGLGIDEDKLNRIFEPFYTTKDRGKGSGLGLSISHGIIKAHGGHIKVKSRPAEGTSISVYLPAAEESEPVEEEATALASPPARGRVLVIDDDQDVAQTIKESLECEGFRVSAVYSGMDALEYYREKGAETDIVMLDMLLPEMSGVEIFCELRELDPGVKVVLCSGYSMEGDATALLEKGALAFMQKPFDIGEAVDIISGLIGSCD